jgi:hypothetical protein
VFTCNDMLRHLPQRTLWLRGGGKGLRMPQLGVPRSRHAILQGCHFRFERRHPVSKQLQLVLRSGGSFPGRRCPTASRMSPRTPDRSVSSAFIRSASSFNWLSVPATAAEAADAPAMSRMPLRSSDRSVGESEMAPTTSARTGGAGRAVSRRPVATAPEAKVITANAINTCAPFTNWAM